MRVFDCGGGENYRRLIQAARRTNAERDAQDREVGSAAPEDCSLDLHLWTAVSAITAGIQTEDWSCVAEGLAMLQDAELRVRSQSQSRPN
jgi:hypothetical protein